MSHCLILLAWCFYFFFLGGVIFFTCQWAKISPVLFMFTPEVSIWHREKRSEDRKWATGKRLNRNWKYRPTHLLWSGRRCAGESLQTRVGYGARWSRVPSHNVDLRKKGLCFKSFRLSANMWSNGIFDFIPWRKPHYYTINVSCGVAMSRARVKCFVGPGHMTRKRRAI